MGRSTNPARIVEVDGVTYLWRTTPDILTLVLAVWPRNLPGARLISVFPISRVVTPKLVRQVVELALAHRYDPKAAKAPALVVQLDPPQVRPADQA
jgi:hypothetical protein